MSLLDVVCFKQAEQWAARNYYRNFGGSTSTHPMDGAVVADRMRLSYKPCSRPRPAVANSGSGVDARNWEATGGDKNVLRSQRCYYTLISSSA
jgi:hypothetical protein